MTITLIGRGLGTFKQMLQIYVSEHDLRYDIPVVGNVLAEDGFADAVRCNQLARKMKELEIDLLETTKDRPFAALIPSSELTVSGSSADAGGGGGGGDSGDSGENPKIALGSLLAGKNKKTNTAEISEADYPTFPNVRWNTFTNALRMDPRNKWKVEPDTTVKVDVIKKRYEQMVHKSQSKWANIEGRFHMAKMISRVSGLTPRTGGLSTARKQKTAAALAFADSPRVSSRVEEEVKESSPPPRETARDVQGSTVEMSAAQRKIADRETETKLLGELDLL